MENVRGLKELSLMRQTVNYIVFLIHEKTVIGFIYV